MSSNEEQQIVSSFLEIAVGQTPDTARQFLQVLKSVFADQNVLNTAAKVLHNEVALMDELSSKIICDLLATGWKLEEALQLFYVGNEGAPALSTSNSPAVETPDSWAYQHSGVPIDSGNSNSGLNNGDEVRAPLPVVRETLYDNAILYGASRIGYPPHEPSPLIAFRNFEEEMKHPEVWESNEGASSAVEAPRDNLASLYRPPFHLMFQGSFEKAKDAASLQEKWLLVNLQATKEFSSHMLNRDTWANEAVSQTVSTNFVFWQAYDDTSEGRKVCTYYKLDTIPVILVIDPITGQKMRSWNGMVQPESLLEDLVPFMDGGPRDHHALLSHKRQRGLTPHQKAKADVAPTDESLKDTKESEMESIEDSSKGSLDEKDACPTEEKTLSAKKPSYPTLTEEPKGDRNLLCRVGIRLPDGRRVQRNFLSTDPIQLLWSFCQSEIGETETKAFRLTQPLPGSSKPLDYDSKLTFAESGVANSLILATWE